MQDTNQETASAAARPGEPRGVRASGTAEHRTVAVQAAGPSVDASGLVGDAAGARAAAGFDTGVRGAASASAPREAFAELDSGPGAVTWTHAGPRQAEAGFEDPTLGWVGVRAEMTGGAVHAALVPGSSEAAQELGRQMDGLHSYLAEQRTPVAWLGMTSPGDRGGDGSGSAGQTMQHDGQGQGAGQGSGQEASGQQAPRQQGSADADAPLAARGMGTGRAAAASSGAVTGLDRMVSPAGREGGHISVVA
jgi:hypothetical protein